MKKPAAYLETSFVGSSNEILEEVYRARELLWERGGGTMRGLVEYLQKREAERLAGEGRGAEPEPDEAWKMAVAVGEERARWKECTMQNAECTMGEGANDSTSQRSNDFTIQRCNDPTIPRTR